MAASDRLHVRGQAVGPVATAGVMALAIVSANCSSEATGNKPSPSGSASGSHGTRPKPDLLTFDAGGGDPRSYVLAERDKAEAEGRVLLIYVGAPWCEPCTRFHDALVAGKLDGDLTGLRFLELDHDKDEATVAALRCTSKLIPLFSLPDATGRCSGVRVEGGIKGEGAVPKLVPEVRALVPP